MVNHSSHSQPTALDLFAGCGGLTQGLVDAGFNVRGAIEIDPLACESYALNHPGIHLINSDIKLLDAAILAKTLSLKSGELDLLAGCPPCQGFSAIRTRNGSPVLDHRNHLIHEMMRLIEHFRPKAVMMENVPHLERHPEFAEFTSSLQKAGYIFQSEILNVADYGVPQRRKRLVLIGSRLGTLKIPKPPSIRTTVREAIGGLPKNLNGSDPLHNTNEKRADRVQRLIAAIPHDGGSRRSLPMGAQLPCHLKTDGFYDVYGRMKWDDVAPTITGGCINPSKGRFLHPTEDRAITLREAALLQGFPKDYKLSLRRGKYAAALLIGNALPPRFSKFHATAIIRHIQDAAPTLRALKKRGLVR